MYSESHGCSSWLNLESYFLHIPRGSQVCQMDKDLKHRMYNQKRIRNLLGIMQLINSGMRTRFLFYSTFFFPFLAFHVCLLFSMSRWPQLGQSESMEYESDPTTQEWKMVGADRSWQWHQAEIALWLCPRDLQKPIGSSAFSETLHTSSSKFLILTWISQREYLWLANQALTV